MYKYKASKVLQLSAGTKLGGVLECSDVLIVCSCADQHGRQPFSAPQVRVKRYPGILSLTLNLSSVSPDLHTALLYCPTLNDNAFAGDLLLPS